jgi:hypothetical protein
MRQDQREPGGGDADAAEGPGQRPRARSAAQAPERRAEVHSAERSGEREHGCEDLVIDLAREAREDEETDDHREEQPRGQTLADEQ